MSIGMTNTPSSLNAQLGGYAIQMRDLMAQVKQFSEWFNGLTAAEQASAFGITAGSTDNTDLVNCVGYLNTLVGLYYGTASQATNYNFDNALSVLWGGQ